MKQDVKKLERMLKGLANRRRLEIIKYLRKDGEATVNEIAAKIRLSLKSTSKHLYTLTHLDILARDQRSKFMFYKINSDPHSLVRHVIFLISD